MRWCVPFFNSFIEESRNLHICKIWLTVPLWCARRFLYSDGERNSRNLWHNCPLSIVRCLLSVEKAKGDKKQKTGVGSQNKSYKLSAFSKNRKLKTESEFDRPFKNSQDEAVQKCPDARHSKFWGTSRTCGYVAVTKNESNATDGRFSTVSWESGYKV